MESQFSGSSVSSWVVPCGNIICDLGDCYAVMSSSFLSIPLKKSLSSELDTFSPPLSSLSVRENNDKSPSVRNCQVSLDQDV